MPFGNKAEPTVVYKYGCKITDNADLVAEQIRLAHRYKNKLVEIEREKRDRYNNILREHIPALLVCEDQIAAAVAEVKQRETEIKDTRQEERNRNAATKEQRKVLADAEKVLKGLYSQLKLLKAQKKDSPAITSESAELDKWKKQTDKEARADCGCYWGTYLNAENDLRDRHKGLPPKFARFDGSGKIATQLQQGRTWEQVLNTTGTLLQFEQLPDNRTGKRAGRKHLVRLRIGSDEKRKPIWVTLTAEVHRPVPSDAEITWAKLFCHKVGTHHTYSLQLSLARKRGWAKQDCNNVGRVAVNLGWRSKGEGSTRVAYWIGDDGEKGELLLPSRVRKRLEACDKLQSTCDLRFEEAKLKLRTFLKANKAPEWLKERTKGLHQWRAKAKLASVVLQWRGERFKGDEEIFTYLDRPASVDDSGDLLRGGWRVQDKHLFDWQEAQRQSTLRYRSDLYRNFAAMLRRKYKELVIADIDWCDMSEISLIKDDDMREVQRRNKAVAAPSRLEEALVASFASSVYLPSRYTTANCCCPRCGGVLDWSKRVSKIHVPCLSCGTIHDQDANHCSNLLSFFGELTPT